MGKEEEKINETTIELIKVINKHSLNSKELTLVLARFLFSLGSSIEEVRPSDTSKDILIKHSEKPTLGNALMAQAIWFRDVWSTDTEREETQDGISRESEKE